MRLVAFIAKTGICARRKAGVYIKEGRVKIGGRIVKEPWYIVREGDDIRFDNKPARSEKETYVIINKPKGFTSTAEDKFAGKMVVDLIPKKLGRLYPVGRLDKDSRGLMVLSNDGEYCYRATHPKFEVEKEYSVAVNGPVDDEVIAKLKKGLYADEEFLKVKHCTVESSRHGGSQLKVVVSEGKKRHLRRLFSGVGLKVSDLKRLRIGGLTLGNLKEGSFRRIDKELIYKLTFAGSQGGCK